jgi:hypothetical protein
MLSKIKRVGTSDGYSNLTTNKVYAVIEWFFGQSGMTFTSGGGGAAYALIVDDAGQLLVTGNVLNHITGQHDWDLDSATYCQSANA